MRKLVKIVGLLLLLLILYFIYISYTTGFFRTIENTYSGSTQMISIQGAEDMAISREDQFMIISSDDREARRDGRPVHSGLYYLDLSAEDNSPELIRADNDVELYPHGISMIEIDSGLYRLLVVNHVLSGHEAVSALDPEVRHTIEEYHLTVKNLIHIRTHENDFIMSPNDVVAIDDQRFYFTNDHGSKTKLGLLAEDFLGFRRSNVVYFDGSSYEIVDDGIAYANGINWDPERSLLYVASPRDFLVKVYNIQSDGTLEWSTDIDCHTGVDNIELDENGLVWIGCHPKLLIFTLYAGGSKEIAPSEIITIEYSGPEDYDVQSVFLSDGKDMSGATTAIPYEQQVYVGNVMDSKMLVLDRNVLK